MDYSMLKAALAANYVTDEDLLKMIEDNGYESMDIPPLDALHQCADGMCFGAILSKCDICGGSLLYLNGCYYCHANTLKRRRCGYSSRDAKRNKRRWKISREITNDFLVDWRENKRLEENRSPLQPTEEMNKNFILHHILLPPKAELMGRIKDWRVLVAFDCYYHVTLTPDGSLLEKNILIYQIVQDGDVSSTNKFYLYKRETRGEKSKEDLFAQCDIKHAIERFESLFYLHTGNTWKSWLEKKFVAMKWKYVPLDIDYIRKIDFGSSLEINDVNDQLLILPEDFKTIFEQLKKTRDLTEIDLSIVEKLDDRRIRSGYVSLMSIHQGNALKNMIASTYFEEWKANNSNAVHLLKGCLFGILGQASDDNVDVEQTVKLLSNLEEIVMASHLANLGSGVNFNKCIRFHDLLCRSARSFDDVGGFQSACELFQIFLTDGTCSSLKEIYRYCSNGEKLKYLILALHGSWFLDFLLSRDKQIMYFGRLDGSEFQPKVACVVLLRKAASTEGNFVLCTAYVNSFLKSSENLRVTWKPEPLEGEEQVLSGIQGLETKKVGFIDYELNGSQAKMEVLFKVSKFSKREVESWHWFFKETAKLVYKGTSPHTNVGNEFNMFVNAHLNDASIKHDGAYECYQKVWEKLIEDDFTPEQSNARKSEIPIVWV